MEAMFYVGELSEQEIEEYIYGTYVSFDVLLFQNGKLYVQNKFFRMGEFFKDMFPRVIHYREGGIKPFGKTYTEFFPDLGDTDEDEVALLAQIPEDVLEDAMDHPENYAWYQLDVRYIKDMPWGICSVRLLPKIPEIDTDYWVYYMAELYDDLYWSKSDKWENGEWTLFRNAVLMRIDGDTEQEIENRMRGMELVMEFSTDFAGLIYWGEYEPERSGYPGMRFSVDVDMTQIEESIAGNMEE